MTFSAARFRCFAIRARDFVRQDGGIAAVEFALILPILVVLWFGGVELTQALSVDRRLNNLASSIGDLVARSKIVTTADVDSIFDIAPGAMYPFCKTEAACNTAGLGMRITAVNINAAGTTATVGWSRGQGKTAYTIGQNVTSLVPATLRVPNTSLIVSEVSFTYTPAVGYVITGNVPLEDTMFFVPRLSTKVQLCTSNPPPTGCVS
jgi:Flp pilus assembly protein TadG